jgi:alkylation response protein AidB-like acyl-CoA dehydrogenase
VGHQPHAAVQAKGGPVEFMTEERGTLQALLPGLDDALAATPLEQLEARESPGIELFRNAGGPGLLIPREQRGLGASACAAIQAQRAIGSRSPSLAVATTMHHFSVATLVDMWRSQGGLEWMLLQGIAEQRLLLASGFAEGIPGQGVYRPTMRGRRADGVVLLNGAKRPCSLARSMDLLTASVAIEAPTPNAGSELAIALVSARLPGIEIVPFWSTPLLAGAQSEAVVLRDVAVEEQLVLSLGDAERPRLDALQSSGFVWFELLITASYVGVASALVERLLHSRRGDATVRTTAAGELESSMAALSDVARRFDDGADPTGLLGKVLLCRYAAQDAIGRATALAVEHLGGMAFINSSDVGYLSACARALAFHPPSRSAAAAALEAALGGLPLEIV